MDKKEADRRHCEALEALDTLAEREKKAGITTETDEYLRLNREVAEAEKHVSWWKRR